MQRIHLIYIHFFTFYKIKVLIIVIFEYKFITDPVKCNTYLYQLSHILVGEI